MKNQKNKPLSLILLSVILTLTACKTAETVVQSTPNDNNNYVQSEYWSIDEFENWMEQQYGENQLLADRHDKSFYDKDANGDYYCREWTQEDVDVLYREWQEQLELMKQGYQFTKSIPYSIDGVISGVFGPETNE